MAINALDEEGLSDDQGVSAPPVEERTALFVQLKVKEPLSAGALKFARRCAEARQLLKDLFLLVERRDMGRTGVLAPDDPSMFVLDPADAAAVERWARKYSSLIHSIIRVEPPEHVVQDVPPDAPKKKKKKPASRVFGFAIVDDEDGTSTPREDDDD